jgi:hypothetical protein
MYAIVLAATVRFPKPLSSAWNKIIGSTSKC